MGKQRTYTLLFLENINPDVWVQSFSYSASCTGYISAVWLIVGVMTWLCDLSWTLDDDYDSRGTTGYVGLVCATKCCLL